MISDHTDFQKGEKHDSSDSLVEVNGVILKLV